LGVAERLYEVERADTFLFIPEELAIENTFNRIASELDR
jgi:hypothetical protein